MDPNPNPNTLCPFSLLQDMGIKDSDDYEDGNFFGNTSFNGITVFEKVTYNLSDLVRRIKVQYENGEEIEMKNDDLESVQTGVSTTQKYGRCYQSDVFKNRNISLYATHSVPECGFEGLK